MQFEHAAFAHFIELLRRRLVPGHIRREQQRQEDFDARYCTTSTECSSRENTSDNEYDVVTQTLYAVPGSAALL